MGTGEDLSDQLPMSEAEYATLLKEFDDTKAGVKGLVDSGITKVPPIFIDTNKHRQQQQHLNDDKDSTFTLPIIDLNGIAENPILRAQVVERIRDAIAKWGFFLIKNHGIPESSVDEMIEGVRRFHEQDVEFKQPFYSRDRNTIRFIYNSNFSLVNGLAANWRDTVEYIMAPDPIHAHDFPLICRDSFMNYSKHIKNLGITLLQLFSEVLGLKPDYLKEEMHCDEGAVLLAHYYPPCPEPNLTWGISEHTDGGFFTILLQDSIGGLQVLRDNQWLDVPYLPGTLIVNIADLLQLISNDRFKSLRHRVISKEIGPRISVACNFRPGLQAGIKPRLFGPIQELLSEDNPAIYKKITVEDYRTLRFTKGLDGSCFLTPFKIKQDVREESIQPIVI